MKVKRVKVNYQEYLNNFSKVSKSETGLQNAVLLCDATKNQ